MIILNQLFLSIFSKYKIIHTAFKKKTLTATINTTNTIHTKTIHLSFSNPTLQNIPLDNTYDNNDQL